MPTGTRVHSVYDALKRKGYGAGKAARISQANTGMSLATGRKPKERTRKEDMAQHEDPDSKRWKNQARSMFGASYSRKKP
jgi:hypothetical protein